MNEWFKAFNADDFKAVHAFAVAHMPGKPDLGNEGFRTMTGGFVIKRVKDLSPTSAEAIVKEQKSEQYARAQIDLDPKDHGRHPRRADFVRCRSRRSLEARAREARPQVSLRTPDSFQLRRRDRGSRGERELRSELHVMR